MINSIVWEPDLNSYFIEQNGNIKWAGADSAAIKIFELEGIPLSISRKIILYARMNQGVWIDVQRFIKGAFVKLAVSESEIEGLIRKVPPLRPEEKTKDMIKTIMRDIDSAIGGFESAWREIRRAIESDLPRLTDEDVPSLVDNLNGWKELLLALNNAIKRIRR